MIKCIEYVATVVFATKAEAEAAALSFGGGEVHSLYVKGASLPVAYLFCPFSGDKNADVSSVCRLR